MALARGRSGGGGSGSRGSGTFGAASRISGGPPAGFWLLVLALGSAWLRYVTPWGVIYPGQWLLIPLAAWAIWQGPLARPVVVRSAGRFEPPPLMPFVAFAGFMLLLMLLRGQWGPALTLVLAVAALAPWAWAAYRLGLGGAPMGSFTIAAIFYLALTLGVGLVDWWVQADWPAACVLVNCDPATPIPFAFRGGWINSAQYLLMLILLLPIVGGAFLESWRGGAGGAAHWLLTLIVAAAGLGLLAGMRWWVFGILALGLFLVAQVMAAQRHPMDGLLFRGLLFFSIFTPIALYGMVPGYGTALLFQAGSARALGVRHVLSNPVVLSSEREEPELVQAVNTGSVPLSASPERPLRLRAMVLFTPRTGGESRMAPAGDARITHDLAPGEAVDVTVPLRVPAWVNQGYVSWAAEDDAGRAIQLAETMHQGFRFVNADYSALSEGGDNSLSALGARARELAAPSLALPAPGSRRGLVEPVLSDAFDTIFFSPLWGQAAGGQSGQVRPFGQVFDPSRSFFLQVLHQYGLIGLGLLIWGFADILRRAIQLGFGRRASGGLAWRLIPVSVVLLAALSLPSGEPGRFHSWWGCVLLGGFVQGTYERVFPQRLAGAYRGGPPGWAQRPVRILMGAARMMLGVLQTVTRGIGWIVPVLQGLTRGIAWVLRPVLYAVAALLGRRLYPRRPTYSRATDWRAPTRRAAPGARRAAGSPYRGV